MDASSLISKEIGNYRITAEINSGASGSVYKAEHSHLSGHMVAIKLLHTYLPSPKERDQFIQEAQFLAMLDHPHILPLLDVGFMERQPYLILKYAAGGSLRDLLKQNKPLPLVKVLTILEQMGQALHYAHSQHIIHRDLKPENILFNTAGEVLLADFGIATMLSTVSVKQLTTISGSPSYMAPEQFRGVISKEGDQYALGCIAYELVTGRLPFLASDFISMGFQHLTKQPPAPTLFNPQLPSTWEAAILKAMAKQRSRRHANIPEFLAALRTPFVQSTASVLPPAFLASPATPRQLSFMQPAVSAPPSTSPASPSTPRHIPFLQSAVSAPPSTSPASPSTPRHIPFLQSAVSTPPSTSPASPSTPRHIPFLQSAVLTPPSTSLASPSASIRTEEHWWLKIGDEHYEAERYEEALAAYEHVLRLNPNHIEAHSNKSVTLLHLERYEEALAACEHVLRLNPDYLNSSTNKDIALHNLIRAQREYSPSKNPFSTVNRIQSHGRKLDSRRAFKGKDEGLSLLREINQARGEPSS